MKYYFLCCSRSIVDSTGDQIYQLAVRAQGIATVRQNGKHIELAKASMQEQKLETRN